MRKIDKVIFIFLGLVSLWIAIQFGLLYGRITARTPDMIISQITDSTAIIVQGGMVLPDTLQIKLIDLDDNFLHIELTNNERFTNEQR